MENLKALEWLYSLIFLYSTSACIMGKFIKFQCCLGISISVQNRYVVVKQLFDICHQNIEHIYIVKSHWPTLGCSFEINNQGLQIINLLWNLFKTNCYTLLCAIDQLVQLHILLCQNYCLRTLLSSETQLHIFSHVILFICKNYSVTGREYRWS